MKPQLKQMVDEQIRNRGVSNPRVLEAMENVPRECFVEGVQKRWAFDDRPLPIACGQTISQPYIVALISEWLELRGDERVLEVGAGCGYQAAILGHLSQEVIAIEWYPELVAVAQAHLEELGISNVRVEQGDGKLGYLPRAPYDRIVVSAGLEQAEIPESWFEQLKEGGFLLLPQGKDPYQTLFRMRKSGQGWQREPICGVRFVPVR